MGVLRFLKNYKTLNINVEDDICYIQIYRPEANNAINQQFIEEFSDILEFCRNSAKVVVLEGTPEAFCFGADFKEIKKCVENGQQSQEQNPEPLYHLWLDLATGPYISVAHVRGKTNAGGVGFVAACDVVLCQEDSVFSLSELLFGLMPACVLPFLIRRIGFSKANYMTLTTQPVSAQQALEWGLVDATAKDSQSLLRKHLLRLRRLSTNGIIRYKKYINSLNNDVFLSKDKAIESNKEVFSNTENLQKIVRYVTTGQFPWEGD